MRVLCIGGSGYLGSHVVSRLGVHDVTVYDDLLYCSDYLKPLRFVRGDVRNYDLLQNWLDWADCVIWLAAIVGDAACNVDPSRAIAVNRDAVEYLAQHYRGKIVFMSSCSVYGIAGGIADETSPLAPQSLYAETKIQAEELLKNAGANAIILRLGTLHGISERIRFDLVVNVLTMKAVSQKRIEVFGGKQYRPLLAVQDAAALIVRLLAIEPPPGVYNLASENLTIAEVAERVKAILPETEVKTVASQFEDQRNYRVDSSKAQKCLGFYPARTIDDSIRDIARVIQQGRINNLGALHYSNLTTLEGAK